jgi:hypothetical protein
MKRHIQALNTQLINDEISLAQYVSECNSALRGLDWQKKIQFQNMMFS